MAESSIHVRKADVNSTFVNILGEEKVNFLTFVALNSGIVGGFGGHVSLGAKDLADEIDKMNNKNDAN